MEKAQVQRQKIYTMKQNQEELFKDEIEAQLQEGGPSQQAKEDEPKLQTKLTSDNLSKMDQKSSKRS